MIAPCSFTNKKHVLIFGKNSNQCKEEGQCSFPQQQGHTFIFILLFRPCYGMSLFAIEYTNWPAWRNSVSAVTFISSNCSVTFTYPLELPLFATDYLWLFTDRQPMWRGVKQFIFRSFDDCTFAMFLQRTQIHSAQKRSIDYIQITYQVILVLTYDFVLWSDLGIVEIRICLCLTNWFDQSHQSSTQLKLGRCWKLNISTWQRVLSLKILIKLLNKK